MGNRGVIVVIFSVFLFLVATMALPQSLEDMWNEFDILIERQEKAIEDLRLENKAQAGAFQHVLELNEDLAESNRVKGEILYEINDSLNERDRRITILEERLRVERRWVIGLGTFAMIVILGKLVGLYLKFKGIWSRLPKLAQWIL